MAHRTVLIEVFWQVLTNPQHYEAWGGVQGKTKASFQIHYCNHVSLNRRYTAILGGYTERTLGGEKKNNQD